MYLNIGKRIIKMSYDLEASVKKLRCMIKIIHFFIHELLLFSNEFICPLWNFDEKTFEIKNLKLKGEAPVELR